MLTRLRNPDSKLSQMKSQQVAAAANEANKLYKETREVCAYLGKLKELQKMFWKNDNSFKLYQILFKSLKELFFQAMEVP